MGRMHVFSFGVLSLTAHAMTDVLGNGMPRHVSEDLALSKRSVDCDWANPQWADVDCFYDFGM